VEGSPSLLITSRDEHHQISRSARNCEITVGMVTVRLIAKGSLRTSERDYVLLIISDSSDFRFQCLTNSCQHLEK